MRSSNTAPQRAMLDAIRDGDLDRVRDLVAGDASSASATLDNGVSAVLLSAYHRRLDIARTLIEAGAPVGLYEACAMGMLSDVRDALDRDAEGANSFSPDGHTPLGLACFFGHLEIAELLLSRGASPNTESRNFQRVAPIHAAAAAGSYPILKLLLDAGANPRKEQDSGFTALHAVAAQGDIQSVRLLVERGANVSARTQDGRMPVALAAEQGHHDVVQFLKR